MCRTPDITELFLQYLIGGCDRRDFTVFCGLCYLWQARRLQTVTAAANIQENCIVSSADNFPEPDLLTVTRHPCRHSGLKRAGISAPIISWYIPAATLSRHSPLTNDRKLAFECPSIPIRSFDAHQANPHYRVFSMCKVAGVVVANTPSLYIDSTFAGSAVNSPANFARA
jgi:hypothetical protein